MEFLMGKRVFIYRLKKAGKLISLVCGDRKEEKIMTHNIVFPIVVHYAHMRRITNKNKATKYLRTE